MRQQAFGQEPPDTLLPAELVAQSAMEMITSNATGLVIDVRREHRGRARTAAPALQWEDPEAGS
jgi:2-C-methyl-D-erythritol 4-phosphate cytidylyltransferase